MIEQRVLALGFGLLVLSACNPGLVVAEGAQIRCTSTADCPDGYECIVQACKSAKFNDPPRVTVTGIERSTTSVTIPPLQPDRLLPKGREVGLPIVDACDSQSGPDERRLGLPRRRLRRRRKDARVSRARPSERHT